MLKVRVTLFSLAMALVMVFVGNIHGAEVVNLLKNGGFEDGVVTPWTTYGTASKEVVRELKNADVPEKPVEGEYCLHLTVAAKGANFWDSGLQHPGVNAFEQGKKYTLSAFLKCKKNTLQINFKPELAVDPWNGYGSKAFTMTDKWAEYSTTTPIFAAKVSPASITFHIAYDAAEFWIDGVRFYEGDYVDSGVGAKPKAVQPQDKLASAWGKMKTDL